MGKYFLLFLLPLFSHILTTIAVNSQNGSPFNLPHDTKSLGLDGPQRLAHIRFFWHDTAAGPNPSAVIIAHGPTNYTSPTNFGTVRVMDDPMTVGPNLSSQLVGRSQGIYLSADQNTSGLLMAMTFNFFGGKFNGSTLAILGRNQLSLHVREMPIIGGTGLFRFATGYVEARTQSVDPTSKYTIVEYNCYFVLSKLRSSDPVDIPLI